MNQITSKPRGINSHSRSIFRKITKCLRLISYAGIFLFSINTASAQTTTLATSQHGTNCMTADLAQGALFSWNRNGLTNNFSRDLFIICPIPLEHTAVAGSNSIRVSADWYLPPSYSQPEGPLCLLRVAQSGFGSPDLNFIENVSNRAFLGPNGSSGFNGFTNLDLPMINFSDDGVVSNDSLISGHILCLAPPGSDFISYTIEWQNSM